MRVSHLLICLGKAIMRLRCTIFFAIGGLVAIGLTLIGLSLNLEVNVENGRMQSSLTLYGFSLRRVQHPPTAFSAYTDIPWKHAPSGWLTSWSYSIIPPDVSHGRGAVYQTEFTRLGDRFIHIGFDQAQNVAKATLMRIGRGDHLKDIIWDNETDLRPIEHQNARPSQGE